MQSNIIYDFIRVLFATTFLLGVFFVWKGVRTKNPSQRRFGFLFLGVVAVIIVFGLLMSVGVK